MAAGPVRLSGEEWQGWANQLLTQRYGPAEYQKVPDNMRGDAGIEGFTLNAGHAYQAYGCEEPISAAERYEKQRDKMTRDINKFVANHINPQRTFRTDQDHSLGALGPVFRQQGTRGSCSHQNQ